MPRIYAKDNVTTAKPDMVTATDVGTKRALDVNIADGDVTLNASDVELGAVELKDATTDTRAVIGASGLRVNIGTDNVPVTLGAGELHLGEIGGSSKVVSPTITVDTAAYSIGDCIGGKLTLTDAMRVSGGTGILQSISVIDASNIKPALDIIIFNSDPTAATLTDQAAMAFSTDISKISRRISIAASDYVTVAGVAIASINPSMIVQAVGSKNLYAGINAVAAHDFVAAGDLQVKFGFIRD